MRSTGFAEIEAKVRAGVRLTERDALALFEEPDFLALGALTSGKRTATQALTNATIPYAMKLANLGFEGALMQVPELRPGLNTHNGTVTYKAVAEAHGMPFSEQKF